MAAELHRRYGCCALVKLYRCKWKFRVGWFRNALKVIWKIYFAQQQPGCECVYKDKGTGVLYCYWCYIRKFTLSSHSIETHQKVELPHYIQPNILLPNNRSNSHSLVMSINMTDYIRMLIICMHKHKYVDGNSDIALCIMVRYRTARYKTRVKHQFIYCSRNDREFWCGDMESNWHAVLKGLLRTLVIHIL